MTDLEAAVGYLAGGFSIAAGVSYGFMFFTNLISSRSSDG